MRSCPKSLFYKDFGQLFNMHNLQVMLGGMYSEVRYPAY